MIARLRVFAIVASLGLWIGQAHAGLKLDVPYGPAGAEQTLDIEYRAGEPAPLIVFVHGGGWERGDKRAGTRRLAAFTPAYAYASVNYRLVPKATVKDAVSDIAMAVAYLQQHAAEYSIDPKRIVLMGAFCRSSSDCCCDAGQQILRRGGSVAREYPRGRPSRLRWMQCANTKPSIACHARA